VIDPPWQCRKIEREVWPSQTGFDYSTMSDEDLLATSALFTPMWLI
jgi:hypothetical protein